MNIDSIKLGDQLPALDIPITARQIVSGAIASQDFEDVHHDKAAANAKGTPDIFMNILTTNGLVGRYLSEWLDSIGCSDGRIKRIKLALGVPNFPGDVMTFCGEVTGIEVGKIEVQFKGRNGLGSHVTGTAYLDACGSTESKKNEAPA